MELRSVVLARCPSPSRRLAGADRHGGDPAAAQTPRSRGSSSGASLDAAIASKSEQLAAVKRNITESDCDYAVDAAIIEGCDQLTAQAAIACCRARRFEGAGG